MSTKQLILQLLELEPSSGYDLAFRGVQSLGPIWSATHSQIYTTLHKMLAGGLVSKVSDHDNGRKRVVYEITEAGRAELDAWRQAQISYLPPRSPLLFWAQHMDTVPLAIVHTRLDEHERRTREALKQAITKSIEIREGRNEILERRQGQVSESRLRKARMSRAAIYDELAWRAQNELEMVGRLRTAAERIAQLDN